MAVNQAAVSRLIKGLEMLRDNAGGYCGYEKALGGRGHRQVRRFLMVILLLILLNFKY